MEFNDFKLKPEVEYKGLCESLSLLKALAKENKIEAIFAFSQGSLLTLILSILIEINHEYKSAFKDVKCVLLFSGFLDPFPLNKEIEEKRELIKQALLRENNNDEKPKDEFLITIPTLNTFGETDEFIPKEKCKNIEKLFKSVTSYCHPGKHFIPSTKDDIEKYLNFLNQYLG